MSTKVKRAVTKFQKAVAKAKRLYKTGRYKNFGAAVKAAYKTVNPSGQTGSSKKKKDEKRKAKAPGKRKAKSGNVYYERRKNRSDKKGSVTGISLKQTAKNNLGKALLDYELANTITATKEAQVRKLKWRKTLKALR